MSQRDPLVHLRITTAVFIALATTPIASSAGLPTGFQAQTIATGLSQPCGLASLPDGRLLVAEKTGALRIVKNGVLLQTPFLDASQLVEPPFTLDIDSERGLLGVAVDPGFPAAPFVYVYYSVCKVPGSGTCQVAKNRVARVTAGYLGNPDRADPGSHVVLLDDIGSDTGIHNAGWLGFSPFDGKLYVAVGDGGTGGAAAQDLGSLNGKVLRLEPGGGAPVDNPFVGQFGARPEVFAFGFRNPWRCRFHPDGRLFCGDVGQADWEEIDWVVAGGNYGWPTTEGPFSSVDYPEFIQPIYTYDHALGGSITMGDFGARTNFPGDYQQSVFFGDYSWQWIKRAVIAADGVTVESVADFDTLAGYVTDLLVGPDGALYATDIVAGTVRRIAATGSNQPPVAHATAAPTEGVAPLTVQFSAIGSSDADGDPLTLLWDFGDGSPTSSDITPLHTYETPGAYTALLTVSDGQSPTPGTDTMALAITVGTVPVVTISAPIAGSLFEGGQTINLEGGATDAEDGPLPASALHWEIRFQHADHWHPFLNDLQGSPQWFIAATTGHTETDVNYWIILRATDSSGLTGEAEVHVLPRLVTLRLDTSPPGLQLTLDGQPVTTPVEVPSVVGVVRTLGAPSPQGSDVFTGWSDGGVQVHTIATPASDTTYTGLFTEAATTSSTSTTSTPIGPTTTSTTSTTTSAPESTSTTSTTPLASTTSTITSSTAASSSTTTPAIDSTSTTAAPRCAVEASVTAVDCRLEELRAQVDASAGSLGRLAGILRHRLRYATSRLERAQVLCDAGRSARARAKVRAARRRVNGSLRKLRARSSRRAIPQSVATALAGQLAAAARDLETVRDGLSCP
jgi:glucose/arabinose dehydrogenase